MIFEKVAALLADYKGIDVNTITMDSSFAELELDSLDVADLVMQIEDELGVSIELDQSVTTMKDLIAKIEEAKNALFIPTSATASASSTRSSRAAWPG